MYNGEGAALAESFLFYVGTGGDGDVKRVQRVLLGGCLVLGLLAGQRQLHQQLYAVVRSAGQAVPVWAAQSWSQVDSPNFAVHYQASEAAIARELTGELEAALAELQVATGMRLPVRLPVWLEPSMSALQQALNDPNTESLGAYYLGRVYLLSPLAWRPDQSVPAYRDQGVIVHELVHALLDYQVNGNTPVWFTEGMAQYWEWQLRGDIWQEQGVDWRAQAVSLDRLTDSFNRVPEYVAYRQSLSLVQWLYDRYGPAGVTRLIDRLATGAEFTRAAQDSLGISWGELEQCWLQTTAP